MNSASGCIGHKTALSLYDSDVRFMR